MQGEAAMRASNYSCSGGTVILVALHHTPGVTLWWDLLTLPHGSEQQALDV
jgi:aryl carrier-like protein